jgi:hypothetical protein
VTSMARVKHIAIHGWFRSGIKPQVLIVLEQLSELAVENDIDMVITDPAGKLPKHLHVAANRDCLTRNRPPTLAAQE